MSDIDADKNVVPALQTPIIDGGFMERCTSLEIIQASATVPKGTVYRGFSNISLSILPPL
jgi:hypothetical protein